MKYNVGDTVKITAKVYEKCVSCGAKEHAGTITTIVDRKMGIDGPIYRLAGLEWDVINDLYKFEWWWEENLLEAAK